MANERIKVVVWDSIGNTVLGVRPWASWDAPTQETLLPGEPGGRTRRPPPATSCSTGTTST